MGEKMEAASLSGGLLALFYIVCALLLLPLTIAFLWTGIRAFVAIRRQLDAARDSDRRRTAA
jgi:hypothetical protein